MNLAIVIMALFSRGPALLRTDHLDLVTETGTIAVVLRRDRRARNYTLRVRSAGGTPVLTMPTRGSLREAQSFLENHTGWLTRQIEKAPAPRPISDGAEIPFRGIPHLIAHRPESRGTVSADIDENGPVLRVAGAAEHMPRRIFDFMRREARRDLEPAVMRYSNLLEVKPKAIRIRDTVTRWGSCSSSGGLSFSFRLVMAPPFVLEYLAAHEVAHLREMNHSQRFWRLVEGICPDHESARRWLLKEGPTLHAIGVDRRNE